MTVTPEQRAEWERGHARYEEQIRVVRKNAAFPFEGDFEHHIIESYGLDPGDCICGHRMSHHAPAAVHDRSCGRERCGCRIFTSSKGSVPQRRISTVRKIESHWPRSIEQQLRDSLDRQLLAIGYNTQDAIERIYARKTFRASFIGGPFGGMVRQLTKTPPRVAIRDSMYHRLDDPDSGEFLGAYTYEEAS